MLKIENSEGVVLAFLNNLESANIHEVLNGEFTLNFVATVEPLKTEFLYDENNLINCEDDLFRVVDIEELHNEDDGVMVSVIAEHISYGLIDNLMDTFIHTNKTATEVMLACLNGTDFTLRTVTVIKKTNIAYTEQCNSKQISIAIANNWQGELQYHRNYVDLLARRGANRGTDFRFGKNLKTVKRKINKAEKTVSWEVEVVQGSEIEELGYYELGDTIRVIDDRLNADYEVRIIDLEKDKLTGLVSKVILGDEIKDLRSSFSSADSKIADAKDKANAAQNTADTVGYYVDANATNWNKVMSVVNDLGNLIPSKIVGELNLAITQIMNSTGTFEQKDNMLYWQNQPTKELSTFASMWNQQGISFSNQKDGLGEWIWTSALSAEGLVATKVLASAIDGLVINAVTLTAANITSGNIKGVVMEGGSAFFGDRVTGNYTEIGADGKIETLLNGNIVTSFWSYEGYGGYLTIYNTDQTEILRIQGLGTSEIVKIDTAGGVDWYVDGYHGLGGDELSIMGNTYINGNLKIYGNLHVFGTVTSSDVEI